MPLPNSASPLATRCFTQINSDAVANGTPVTSLYPPQIEAILKSVFTQLKGDSLMSASDQTVFTNQLNLMLTDSG